MMDEFEESRQITVELMEQARDRINVTGTGLHAPLDDIIIILASKHGTCGMSDLIRSYQRLTLFMCKSQPSKSSTWFNVNKLEKLGFVRSERHGNNRTIVLSRNGDDLMKVLRKKHGDARVDSMLEALGR